MSMIYDQKTLADGNVFKFEQQLKTQLNRYIDNGALLVDYFSQDENSSTVDRGLKSIDELFGKNSPLRFNIIHDFPVYGFGSANPENSDEQQIEDINVNGEIVILPSTIVPKPMDFFIIRHLKMTAIFEITNVAFDSMKVDGFYKVSYRLHSTSQEVIDKVMKQVINTYHTDLNMVCATPNPIIKEDDFVLRGKIQNMTNKMINAYRSLFYNNRHNCFIFDNGVKYFDVCANEFISKYSLMNIPNDYNVIVLNDKLGNTDLPLMYNKSIYSWIELGAPDRLLQKFPYIERNSDVYPYSSFAKWSELIQIIVPLSIQEKSYTEIKTLFDDETFSALINNDNMPYNEYEQLLWKYIHRTDLKLEDIPLTIADTLINSIDRWEVFFYTPIIIYIIREILKLN